MSHDRASSQTRSGRDVALALAQEMRTLCDLSHRLPLAAGLDPAAIVAAQDQDLLAQTLEELALFLERSAEAFGTQGSSRFGPALDRIRLHALAERLGGGAGAPAQEAGGELELL